MATQGQRRSEALGAIRELRRAYRKTDSMGERVERELDRLIKRKTLIGPDAMATTAKLIKEYYEAIVRLQSAYAAVWTIVKGIPV